MDYKFRLETQPDGKMFVCDANINFDELKKDMPRIIARDKNFVHLIAISIITSKKFGENMEYVLSLIRGAVKIEIGSRGNVFHYARHGSLRDLTICFATAFAAQPTLRDMFFQLIEEHVKDNCLCDKCIERRKTEGDSPDKVKKSMEDLINQYKSKNNSGG